MSIAIKDFVKKFMPRDMIYTILKNKAPGIEKDSIRAWKEAFGVLAPLVEVRKHWDAIEFEDEYKKKVSMMTLEIQQLASRYEQNDTIIIEGDIDIPPTNPIVLTKEEI